MPTRTSRRKVDLALPAELTEKFQREFEDWVRTTAGTGGFANQYLAENVFSKFLDPKRVPPEVRGAAAIHKWKAAEQRNLRTNQRLMFDDIDLGWIRTSKLVRLVRREIARILGPIDYPNCLMQGGVTNGASTSVRRSAHAAVDKLSGRIALSEDAIPHWLNMASGTMLSKLTIDVDNSSVLFTVPKKTEIDRVACKEPSGNMLLQRSLGNVIRARLKRAGCDLNDQTKNQELARYALLHGLATIDLSSASDTVSQQIVFELLPFEWWSVLDDLRVKTTLIGEDVHHLSMFSSMGNGFTFELESLIFLAITRVVTRRCKAEGPVSVYGDDIICPASIALRLDRVFSFFGFVMNLEKSHYRGGFRESCGRHYYFGRDVTPFYLRRAVATLPELINVLNHLLEWDGRGYGFFTTEVTYRFWQRWIRYVPRAIWGGIDTDDPMALVTGHSPRKRIVFKTDPMVSNEEGRLLLWFVQKQHLQIDDLQVDPRVERFAKLAQVVARGARSTWSPGIAWD